MSLFVVAAGGTGGHMVPAHVLAEILRGRGHAVALVTDDRGLRFPGLFEQTASHVIPSGTPGRGGVLGWPLAFARILAGRRAARALYRRLRPAAVIGFGGYPALPAILGAIAEGVPTIIHEQNAVLGRVNRLLAAKVDHIATSYANVRRLRPAWAMKTSLTGNPTRDEVIALRDQPYPEVSRALRLLIVGGSQGASILSRVAPAAIAALPFALRERILVTQQCRPEDIDSVRRSYAAANIPAHLETYIDVPARLADTHFVIARSGASTVAELTCAGRPALFVPLATSTDDHQTLNTEEMVQAGGATMISQAEFVPVAVTAALERWLADGSVLVTAAAAARSVGRPFAGAALADLALSMEMHQ
ncbi:MAG: UDP-N-acetylglucosamine--N-acetylmuramyl-(pentapeptide) pyrophosphoryl-undecaprenol N-acetylglucosamine transferase [Janthinobacterium lividum]